MNKFTPNEFFDLKYFQFADIFQDAQSVWEALNKLEEFIKEQFISGRVVGNYRNNKYVYVGKNTEIQKDTMITGPAIIGENCIITHGSLLRGSCLLGDNVRIGHGSEIKESIFLNNSVSAHLNYVGNSIIGNDVNISGGTIFANFRLDKKTVTIKSNNDKIETGLLKFGSIIGDDSSIGVSSVLNPGTIIGKNTIIYPLISVSGVHMKNEIIKK